MTTVLLVRHADSTHPNLWGGDEVTRPLTEQGCREALALAERLRAQRIDAIYSSPYRRAIQTVEPLAAQRGLPVQQVHDFREHRLSPEPIAHWREVLETAWRNFQEAPGGADTLDFTQRRGLGALEAVRARHPDQSVAIGGHGTIFACVLHALHPGVDCGFLLAMPMPAVYELMYARARWQVRSGPGITSGPG